MAQSLATTRGYHPLRDDGLLSLWGAADCLPSWKCSIFDTVPTHGCLCRGEKRMRFEEDDGEEEDDSGEAEDIHYKDFFDPAEQAPADAALQDASGDATSHPQSPHDVI